MRDFIKYWIISNISYTTGIVLAMFFLSDKNLYLSLLPCLVPLCNLYGLLCIYYACCVVDNIAHKQIWGKYILILLMYAIVGWVCNIGYFMVTLPFFLIHVILIAMNFFIIFRRWQFSPSVKYVAALVIFAHAASQMFLAYIIIFKELLISAIFMNMLFLIMINYVSVILYQKTTSLKENMTNDYIRLMAENAIDILFYYTFNPHKRFTYISPSVEKVIGYKQEDFYSNPNLHIEITVEEDRAIMEKAFSTEVSSLKKNYICLQRKGGEYAYLEFHNNPIYSAGELIAMEGILQDITARVIAEKEMADAKKARQLLLSYISHELKTPITYITGYAELLHDDMLTTEKERKNAIELILSKSVFLQNLVEDLFQLSMMEANQYSFEFMQMSAYSLYKSLTDEHRNDFMNTSLSYTTEIDEALKDSKYEVLVDLKRMNQIYTNLISNAIKNSPDSGHIKFSCHLDEPKENVVFEITDFGRGIEKEEIPNIFKAFYKVKRNVEKQGGSGLGLSLCQQIINAHWGSIDVVSQKNQGSTFRFKIPLYTEGN